MEADIKPDEIQSESGKPTIRMFPNVPMVTTGGIQVWADELFCHGWHIQRNLITRHCRLLDARQVHRAWGSFAQCHERLQQIRREQRLPPMSGKAVIVLHGMFRNTGPMLGMSRFLRSTGDYTVFTPTYPSNWRSVGESAKTLARLLASLEGIEEINFVCHSLGNIVVRHYLADCGRGEHGGKADPRIRRMVMLGPPNNGSELTRLLQVIDPFGLLITAKEIRNWESLSPRLATPNFEFGIIAGGRGQPLGYNPLLRADNDFIVTVESTRLAGASDFALLPVLHALMGFDRRVQQHTLNFLNAGHFSEPDRRQPIVADGAVDSIQRRAS